MSHYQKSRLTALGIWWETDLSRNQWLLSLSHAPIVGTRNAPRRTTCLSSSASLGAASEGELFEMPTPADTNHLKELEKKAWFRFLKLCYIFVYILAVAFVMVLAYGDLPRDYLDNWGSRIVCNSGMVYETSKNSIYPVNGNLDQEEDAKARKLCAYDITRRMNEMIPPPPPGFVLEGSAVPAPTEKNYKLVTERKTRGSYKEVAKTLIWGLGTILFLGEVVRRSFLYVVAGKRFFS